MEKKISQKKKAARIIKIEVTTVMKKNKIGN